MSIRIHIVRPALVPAGMDHLTKAEQQRAGSFRFEKDAIHWVACRTALREVLASACGLAPREVPIHLTPHGKPILAAPFTGIHFNLSHCRDLALIAVSASLVGIDIEPRDRAIELLECEASFCHPDEIARLPAAPQDRAQALLEIWTKKEALLKALGTGFLIPPEQVLPQNFPGFRLDRLSHQLLEKHLASVAAEAAVSSLDIRIAF